MEKKPFYLTTPLYYVNDVPHIGHSYTEIASDVLARYKRLAGFDVFYLTGTDEHGQKIERTAKNKELSPKELADQVVVKFQNLWDTLNISYDDFIRTTEPRHEKVVQSLFQKLYDQGDIYKGYYEGWYCTPCETFFLENQLGEEHTCPDCGRPTELIKEENYFFKISKYEQPLLDYIKAHPDCIQPEYRRNEIVKFIEGGLHDQSVSRTTFDWGVPLPFDKKHVIYVWFDALINYISALGYGTDEEKFNKYWPSDVHFVGKDIIKFHCVIWPAILLAAGLEPPKKVFAHGWWLVEGEKMSKSKGNAVDPNEVTAEFGVDAYRYFLLREVPFGLDGNFSRAGFIQRTNADLANDLGNLLNRTLTMIEKYFGGVIPEATEEAEVDKTLNTLLQEVLGKVDAAMDRIAFSDALSEIWRFISYTNKYIDLTTPWVLAKDDAQKGRLATVMYNLAESLRIIGILVKPFMPETAEKIYAQLGIEKDIETVTLDDARIWGKLANGISVQKDQPIFPRIEVK